MAINSRRKGNSGERIAAKLWTEWTNRTFAKVPRSGGLHWHKHNTIGDIVCTIEGHYCPFSIEVKNHKEIDFSQLLLPKLKNVVVLDFWAQAITDAERAKKVPMLMMRYNNLPKDFFFCMVPAKFWAFLKSNSPENNKGFKKLEKSSMVIHWDKIVFPSTLFFSILEYKECKKIAKTYLKEIYG